MRAFGGDHSHRGYELPLSPLQGPRRTRLRDQRAEEVASVLLLALSHPSVRGETVWKIVGRVGSGASWSSKTSKRRLFTPSPRLIRPRNGAYLEFPDSLSTHSGE